MKLRKGFMLLEVILALAIGTILSLILLQSVGSMNTLLQRLTTISSLERRYTLVQQQFDRDFSGVFVPQIVLKNERHPNDKETEEDKKEKPDTEKSDKDKKKEQPLPHAFYSQNDDGNCKAITFITSNPITVYGQTTPRVVRVAYHLEKDPENPGQFALFRQQSDLLDYKKFIESEDKKIRRYKVADGIARLQIDYLVPKVAEDNEGKPQKKPADKQKKKKVQRELMPIQEWKELDREEEKKAKRPKKPSFIHVTLTLLDQEKRPSTFELWYAPLYDAQPYLIKNLFTLPSRSDDYHKRFLENKIKNQHQMQEDHRRRQEERWGRR